MLLLLLFVMVFSSCWNWDPNGYYAPTAPMQKVWGSRPVYAAKREAKVIQYTAGKQPLLQAGNIYAFGSYIFQVDVGSGIHVIDNTDPAAAERIGFITVHGCTQLSIRGHYLYTNSLDDLVTIDISNPAQLREVNRAEGAFPEMAYSYPLVQPAEKGYFACPRYDSVVIGWVKDSVYATCSNF
jgi:hypothetical protein